ncbi:HNH endonuclease signature motif containing protein [Mycobacteroides abscessus]|uniref:HNH endonuclease signature motif containing protein n=2 Tax=Mycobacteroides abscessus TaxID=36809 RepID=UPI00373FDDEF
MDRRIPRVTARPVPWTASFGVVMRRFPGCSQPAESADLDHSIPYAIGGHTSADNLKALCRKHYRLAELLSSRGHHRKTAGQGRLLPRSGF